MRKYIKLIESVQKGCPVATADIDVNLKNRQNAIDNYHYGPANPDKPENYWKDSAKPWGVSEAVAKTMTCSVCAAFDVSDKMYDCIRSGIQGDEKTADGQASINIADIGYCNFLHFKCAGSRSCTAWVSGGPIDNKDRTG